MADLIVPHGGLTEPVCCTVAEGDRDSFLAEAGGLTSVPVSAADLSTVYRIADGTLSPLTGPLLSPISFSTSRPTTCSSSRPTR